MALASSQCLHQQDADATFNAFFLQQLMIAGFSDRVRDG
jgi:hypothetical protein